MEFKSKAKKTAIDLCLVVAMVHTAFLEIIPTIPAIFIGLLAGIWPKWANWPITRWLYSQQELVAILFDASGPSDELWGIRKRIVYDLGGIFIIIALWVLGLLETVIAFIGLFVGYIRNQYPSWAGWPLFRKLRHRAPDYSIGINIKLGKYSQDMGLESNWLT